MANNRLWLVHRPSGQSVYLGKRMAVGWHDAPADLAQRVAAFFEKCSPGDQDDFALAIEDAEGAPCCIGDWAYDEDHRPKVAPDAKTAALDDLETELRNQGVERDLAS